MQISEVTTRTVDLADPNMKARDAAIKMREDDVGALPVGENDRLIGMVTDRDIVMRAVAVDRPAENTSVRDAMSEASTTASRTNRCSVPGNSWPSIRCTVFRS